MNKGIKKIKFHKGQDSHQALMRKLLVNFIEHGKLETTLKRAKAVKSSMDRLTYKSITQTEGSKNVLLKTLGSQKIVTKMMKEIAPVFKTGTSGFVRMERLGQRQGDNAEVAVLTWTKDVKPAAPVVQEKKTAEKKIVKEVAAPKAKAKK